MGFVPLLIGALFVGVGWVITRIPPERLLAFDVRTARYVHDRTLARTGSRDEALAAAGRFYKLFGCMFAILGAGMGSALWLLMA